jgi:serine O-acetyltransferase
MHSILFLIRADAYRYSGSRSIKSCIRSYLRIPGFRFMVWHRIAHSYKFNGSFLYIFPWLVLSRLKYKYGFDIPAETVIGKGFYIGHFGGVVISPRARIGCNCNISQGVTIGFSSRGARKGYPIIGNNVYIGPGVKIIGKVRIGNNAAIGANAVVLTDVPDNGVAVGIPAKVISLKGAGEYILNYL